MPTFSPSSRSASARLTAVVDLPTPPLPEATAMMAATPGMPAGDGAAGPAGGAPGRARPAGEAGGRGGAPRAGPALPERSAVSATITDCTPDRAVTAFGARSRTASQAVTA